jgi:hypothetical protein
VRLPGPAPSTRISGPPPRRRCHPQREANPRAPRLAMLRPGRGPRHPPPLALPGVTNYPGSRVVKDPNARLQEAMALVFRTFRETYGRRPIELTLVDGRPSGAWLAASAGWPTTGWTSRPRRPPPARPLSRSGPARSAACMSPGRCGKRSGSGRSCGATPAARPARPARAGPVHHGGQPAPGAGLQAGLSRALGPRARLPPRGGAPHAGPALDFLGTCAWPSR